MSKLKTVWNNRKKIMEGVKNNVFKKEHIEEIASERISICKACPFIDEEGSSCLAVGTQPCCSKCGCSLKFKIRSLSSGCGDEQNPKWHALISETDEESIE